MFLRFSLDKKLVYTGSVTSISAESAIGEQNSNSKLSPLWKSALAELISSSTPNTPAMG